MAIFFLFPGKKFLSDSKFSCWKLLPQKRRTKTKAAVTLFYGAFSLPAHFEFFAIFSRCLHFSKFVCLLKRLERLKQEWQKSSCGIRRTYGKNQVWFGEIERKFAKLSKAIFTYLIILWPLPSVLWPFELLTLSSARLPEPVSSQVFKHKDLRPLSGPSTLIKKKRKFSSYIRKFRWDRLQSHI